jgi:hypothetical protein
MEKPSAHLDLGSRPKRLVRFTALHAAIVLLLMTPGSANATRARTILQSYEVGELFLLKTEKFGLQRAACFATIDHKIVWAKKGTHLGKSFARIASVEADGVNIVDTELDSGGDWVERHFFWRLDDKKTGLSKKCGMPKSALSR